MIAFEKDWKAAAARSWPGGAYMGTCRHCRQTFVGPKRAPSCLTCHNTRAEEIIRRQKERDDSWAEVKAQFEEQADG